jgi:uncharacterized protein YjeT (DUF2065 family)
VSDDWTILLAAFALMLVFEGLLPFAAPRRYRRMVEELRRLGDNQLRTVGLVVMLSGLFLLFLIRS